MSKSLKNFFRIDDVLKVFDPEAVRFFVLRSHYRSPLNYSAATLRDAKNALDRLYTSLNGIHAPATQIDWNEPVSKRFRLAMDDDFNTPEAVAVLFEMANELNRSRSPQTAGLLKALGGTLGLLQRDPSEYLQAVPAGDMALTPQKIEELIAARVAAKKGKNYKEADRIRTELLSAGVQLEDTAQGTVWRRV
jgi:cysteinyl-tRNA synthetase